MGHGVSQLPQEETEGRRWEGTRSWPRRNRVLDRHPNRLASLSRRSDWLQQQVFGAAGQQIEIFCLKLGFEGMPKCD